VGGPILDDAGVRVEIGCRGVLAAGVAILVLFGWPRAGVRAAVRLAGPGEVKIL